jgi:hypothetical protein
MAIPKGKNKFLLWAKNETYEKVEQLYRDNGCKTKSEFIEKAINFYCGFLSAEEYKTYLPEVVISIIESAIDGFENRVASLLFKMAVEINMMLHVTAATNEIDEETLSELRGLCVGEVQRLHGKITFDEALKFQKG